MRDEVAQREKWLVDTGAHILDRNEYQRYSSYNNFSYAPGSAMDKNVNMIYSEPEYVYKLEVSTRTIDKWIDDSRKIAHIMSMSRRSSSCYNESDYVVKVRERHTALLKDNQMYKDSWREFQAMRSLLGEDSGWPYV